MSSDCLVLHFEELNHVNFVPDSDVPDASNNLSSIFILFDPINDKFFLCGNKVDKWTNVSNTYRFHCKMIKYVIDYIRLVTKENHISVSLYNFDNLPRFCDNIDYDILLQNKKDKPELEYLQISDTNDDYIRFCLDILKHVKNN